MREMQSSSGSRDDRQKREQQREEKELAKIAQLADAHRKQQQQQHQEKQEKSETEVVAPKNMAAPRNQDQRGTLKFGFSKMAPSKVQVGNASKKPKVATKVSSVFGNESDEDS